ncbi:hypothetical protein TrVE_jg2369 [Triparma verrucosa]|uniref:Uncharacterized protein n=1 Tax=Triparma verrucosa TaxID=1606542 RepID=A0A9W7BBK8_9STRA|nr:hypothetical protein TrVE_jg2369 [Triparma verrucosa]
MPPAELSLLSNFLLFLVQTSLAKEVQDRRRTTSGGGGGGDGSGTGSPDYSGICNDGNDWLPDLSVTTPDG